MEKFKSWADFSDDDSSATEEEEVSDPLKLLMIQQVNKSSEFIFQVENLPYSMTGPEDLYRLFDLKPGEINARLQYKGKKFTGYAIVEARDKPIALRVASKYGIGFNGRSLLVFFKDQDGSWLPRKKDVKNNDLNSTRVEGRDSDMKRVQKSSIGQGKKSNICKVMEKDSAVLHVYQSKCKTKVFN